jgi:hypothetical protein
MKTPKYKHDDPWLSIPERILKNTKMDELGELVPMTMIRLSLWDRIKRQLVIFRKKMFGGLYITTVKVNENHGIAVRINSTPGFFRKQTHRFLRSLKSLKKQ